MSEFMEGEGYVDTGIKTGTVQVDDFSHELNDFLSDDNFTNKEEVSNVLKTNSDLKNGFEEFLKTTNSLLKIKCKKSLQGCNTEDEIKSVIAEVIPGGYRVGTVGSLEKEEAVRNSLEDDEDILDNVVDEADREEDKADREEDKAVREEDKAVREEDEADREEDKADREEDKADREEDKADREEDKAVREEDKAVREEDKLEKNNEQLPLFQAMSEAIITHRSLIAKYGNLEENTNEYSSNYQKVKKQLENNGVINQLKNELDDKVKEEDKGRKTEIINNFINDYILVQTTLVELKTNPTSYEQNDISFFDKVVKNLDNACKIPDTNLNSFSSGNISQTRTELFNEDIGNESLRKTKDSNMGSKSHQEAYDKIFPEMGEEDVITKYGNLLEGKLKVFWNQYQNNSEIKKKITEFKNNSSLLDEKGNLFPYKKIEEKNLDLADDDKILLKNYDIMRSAINEIKENTDKKTKDMMEEMCIISQIKGMYMCMGEGDDFNLNKAKEIESENGILTLKGHIDGVDFAIRQDTNNPEARLQTSQKLARSKDGKMFTIGGENNFTDSNFILPTQNEVFATITETIQDDKSLENFENQSDYLENLQTNIVRHIDEKYENTKYVQHYMKEQVKGEKVVNNTLGLINKINPSIANNETLMNINQASNPNLYDFIKILKFNIDNSTNAEKDNLNQCITKILEITSNYKDTNGIESSDSFGYSPIIENFLKNNEWLEDGNEDKKLGLLSDLFKYYSENSRDARLITEGGDGQPSKMIINDLYRDLFEFSSGASEIAVNWETQKKNEERKKRNEKIEAREKDPETLDGILDLGNSGVWSA